MPECGRPTWISLDLAAAAHNMRRLREIAGVPIMAVVKANAYGHDAVALARVFVQHGAERFAVATLGEARTLREAGITAPIMILGYVPPWQAAEAAALRITCAVYDLELAQALSQAATAHDWVAPIHLKLDTGMSRLGLHATDDLAGATLALLHALHDLPGIHVEGLFTHFATADNADLSYAEQQLARFQTVLAAVTAAGVRPPLVHAANSAATLRLPAARFDLVRPGIASYGLHPSADAPLPPDFQPVLALHSELAQVKQIAAGTPVSYGCTWVAPRPTLLATLPIGYADGLRRTPPWREVLLHGQRAPIVGRICMDYVLLDVTDIAAPQPLQAGDPVVLLGAQPDPRTGAVQRITAEEVAGWLGTINYEVTSALMSRIPRTTTVSDQQQAR